MQKGPALFLAAARRPAFWLWLALSAWPPELISDALGLQIVDPGYVGLMLAWWPLDVLAKLGALAVLLDAGGLAPHRRGPWPALPSALSAEVLLGLRTAALGLLGLVPGVALLSLAGIDTPIKRWSVSLLCLAGLIPALLYTLRRLLSSLDLLLAPVNAGAALDASANRLKGRLWAFLKLAWPWLALSLALDGLGLVVEGPAGLPLSLLSLALSILPLGLALGL